MKNPIFILVVAFFVSGISLRAQNWNVFNTMYRYNYRYNHNSLVSQVLFTDSVKSIGTYTVNYLNRIGVECTGSCPTITTALNQNITVIVPNVPQFLQREIIKYNNGYVVLSDTAKLVLIPNCLSGQTWLFDSINNKNATCVSQSVQTVFGMPDSVKLIIVDGTDTLKFSKNFGIIQFPNLYNKNKYYRLVGIENSGTYDSTALYGEKVPNAWDFYKFEIGERFCYQRSSEFGSHNANPQCTIGNYNILAKTITASGYIYSVDENWDTCATNGHNLDLPGSASQRTYTNLTSALFENVMYPGQVVHTTYYPANPAYNIVKFAKDNNGIFFKYAGISCGVLNFTLPFIQDVGYVLSTNGYLAPVASMKKVAEVYASGLGVVQRTLWELSWFRDFCLVCSLKNGIFSGTDTYVGIAEQKNDAQREIKIYPNPSRGKIHISTGNINANELRVISLLGEEVMVMREDMYKKELEIDLSASAPGIYFVQILQNGVSLNTKKVVRN